MMAGAAEPRNPETSKHPILWHLNSILIPAHPIVMQMHVHRVLFVDLSRN